MVSDFINQSIFWEYRVEQLDPDQWPAFIVKEVVNRNVITQTAAIPSMLDYYGRERVEQLLKQELWLTSEGIKRAQKYFPHLRKVDFVATRRIRNRKRQLARVGEYNPKL